MNPIDAPKIWTGEVEFEESTVDIIDSPDVTDVAVVEQATLPSVDEQRKIIEESSLNTADKSVLGSLVEINNIYDTLSVIQNDEVKEKRAVVLESICSAFIHSRMTNNAHAEALKFKLLNRLSDNIENLDLQTVSKIYNDLTAVSSIDAQQAGNIAAGMGSAGGVPGAGGGIQVNINNATAEGASITNATANVNGAGVNHLKETASLNASLKSWGNIPKQQPVNITPIEDE